MGLEADPDLEGFIDEKLAGGTRQETLEKYRTDLLQFKKAVDGNGNKDFRNWDKRDVIKALSWLNRQDFSPETKAKKKEHLKAFFKWLRGCEGRNYPPEVSWFTCSVPYRDKKTPEDILTEEELLEAVEQVPSVRNKALFSLLYDIAPRPHEFNRLRIRDVTFDEYSYVVRIPGETKTGSRRVRGTVSTPYLRQWLEIHPYRDDSDGPLFTTQYSRREKTRLGYEGLRKICRYNMKYFPKRLRRLYPYVFRHSRATHLAKHMTEAQLCQHFGWVQGSRMPRTYIHLSGRDVDNTMLEMYNLKPKEDRKEAGLMRCPICREMNPPSACTCWKCHRDMEAARDVIEELREEMRILKQRYDEIKRLDLGKNPHILLSGDDVNDQKDL